MKVRVIGFQAFRAWDFNSLIKLFMKPLEEKLILLASCLICGRSVLPVFIVASYHLSLPSTCVCKHCSLWLLITFHSVYKTTTLSTCVCKHCSLWRASSETSLILTAIATEFHPSRFESTRGPSLISRPSPRLCLVTSGIQTQRRRGPGSPHHVRSCQVDRG